MTITPLSELSDLFDRLEQRFGIRVPGVDREMLDTPGAVVDYLCARLSVQPSSTCECQRAFHRLRSTLMHEFALTRASITPSASLDALVPRKGRLKAWQAVRRGVGAAHWPELRRGAVHERLVWYGGVVVGCVVLVAGLVLGVSPALALLAGFIGAGSLGALLARLTDSRRTGLPSGYQDVASLVRFMVADRSQDAPSTWTREIVVANVAEILASEHRVQGWLADADLRRGLAFD